MNFHDAYRNGTVTNLSYSTSGGAAVSTAGFGSQTYWISLTAAGAFTTTGGVRVNIGDGPVATSSSALLPFNWTEKVNVSPGQKVSALSNDGIAGTLVVVELTN
jgi:hypothetical protein